MPAATTDLFMKVGTPNTATTLSAPGYTAGQSTPITVASTAGWSTDTRHTFAIDRVQNVTVNGVTTIQRIAGTYCEFTGIVTSSTQISNIVLQYGNSQDYISGSTTRVYIPITSTRENFLVDGLAIVHNLDGTLKNGIITTAKIADSGVTTAKIADSNVTTSKIADANVTFGKLAAGATRLGLAKRAQSASSLLTTTLTTYLTITATSTGKECEVTFTAYFINANAGASRDLTVQVTCDGTIVDEALGLSVPFVSSNNNPYLTAHFTVSSTPAAGSHTWNFQASAAQNTAVTFTAARLKVAEVV